MLDRVKQPIPLQYSQAEPRELRHRVDIILVIIVLVFLASFLLIMAMA